MDKFFFDKFLNLIFPSKCGFCGDITGTDQFICRKCHDLSTQKYINRCKFCGKISYDDICFECNNKNLYYDSLIFCSEYTEEFKQKIHLYKFSDKKYYYHFFSELIYERIKDEEFDLIIPVPISRERYKERGYNQSGIISRKLAKMVDKPYNSDILLKIKNNKRQSMQTFKERQNAVKDVFKVADNISIVNKKILLVDDIFTTGATVNECSRVLKLAGAENIKVAVICISHMLK